MKSVEAGLAAFLLFPFFPSFTFAKPQLTKVNVNGHAFQRVILYPSEVFSSQTKLETAKYIYSSAKSFMIATYKESGLISGDSEIIREGGSSQDILSALQHSITFVYFEEHVQSLDQIDIKKDIAATIKIFLPNESGDLPLEEKLKDLKIQTDVNYGSLKIEVGNLAKSKRWNHSPIHYFIYRDFEKVIDRYLPDHGRVLLETSAGGREKNYRIYGFASDHEFEDPELGLQSVAMSTTASHFLQRLVRLGSRQKTSSQVCKSLLTQDFAYR